MSETPLSQQLEHVLAARGSRILVIKTVADEQFVSILSALMQARPNAQITSLVSADSLGVEEEVGEVLRVGAGWRTVLRRLSRGFDAVIIAVDLRQYRGIRRLVTDTATLVAHPRVKVVCSQRQVLAVQELPGIALAPVVSVMTLVFGMIFTCVLAIIAVAIVGACAPIGEGILRFTLGRIRTRLV